MDWLQSKISIGARRVRQLTLSKTAEWITDLNLAKIIKINHLSTKLLGNVASHVFAWYVHGNQNNIPVVWLLRHILKV